MPGAVDPLYVRARTALLDALDALEPHLDALVLVGAEPVKPGETTCHADLMSASGVGSLIQATVGSLGGSGRRCPKRAGLAV